MGVILQKFMMIVKPLLRYGRVPTNLENTENLELSENFVNLEKSGNLGIWSGIFMTCHMVHDLLIDELIFACNV